MSTIQLYVYISGFLFFLIGCYLYYLSKNKNLTYDQKKIRKRGMNFSLIIALICVIYSWL